jgi:hypothetical protein
MPEPTCSKQIPSLCGQPAVEFLLVSGVAGNWTGKARCKDHPAADDLRMVRRVDPSLTCLVAKVVPGA